VTELRPAGSKPVTCDPGRLSCLRFQSRDSGRRGHGCETRVKPGLRGRTCDPRTREPRAEVLTLFTEVSVPRAEAAVVKEGTVGGPAVFGLQDLSGP
jgi:hypothetical protein